MDRHQIVAFGLVLMAAGPVAAQPPGPGRIAAARAGSFATIQGNAIGSTGEALPQASVRLRDARMGRDIQIQITDRLGLFTFATIEPGSYIVELLSADHRVLSTSEVIHVGGGDTALTVVRLPGRPTGVFDRSAIAAVSAVAAGAGVLGKTATGSPISPRQ